MWFRDVAFVTCVCFGAYALTELGVRVFRNRVVPHERLEKLALEKLSLVVLALAGAICALVSRGEARRARLNTFLVQRSARRDALFHQKVLTAVSKRDPSKDRAGATRVDLLAHLARVDPCSSSGARVTVRDPHPNLPPLLATPARRTAARDACRRASGVTGGTQLCHVPASFHLADVLDGATRKSRALTANGDCNANVELAATLEVHASASQGHVWEIAGEESTTRFATGGVSLDPKDGLDRVVAVASVLVDLANGNSLTGLQPGRKNKGPDPSNEKTTPQRNTNRGGRNSSSPRASSCRGTRKGAGLTSRLAWRNGGGKRIHADRKKQAPTPTPTPPTTSTAWRWWRCAAQPPRWAGTRPWNPRPVRTRWAPRLSAFSRCCASTRKR